ncbi:MAG: hypothetical protein MJ240_02730 [Kiritimatiellae bacterium]|nr:hypothetical protein [Kiritimatiellia bacterium]
MNKAILVAAAALTLMAAKAEDAYALVNDAKGYSYIQINEDLDSFKFTSDFKSIGNSGKVGFFVYPEGLEGDALKKYINEAADDNAMFGKQINHGEVDLGALKAGDRVGFYLDRNNGRLVRDWSFETKHGTTYIAFDKNGGGKDEWMPINNVTTTAAGSGSGDAPAGQPLPGALAMLALGGLGAGVAKLRGKKKAK